MKRVAFTRSFLIALVTVVLPAACLHAESDALDLEKLPSPAFANKSFSFGSKEEKSSSLFSSSNSSFSKTFDTKNADSLFSQPANIGGKEITTPAVNMNKSYVARSSTLPTTFTGFDHATNSIPLKSSAFGSQSAPGFNRNLDMPTYTGRETTKIQKDLADINNALATKGGLPDRNLTIQEVRDLLNHNAKPEADPAPKK